MSMELSREKWQVVLDNMGLVHNKVQKQFKVFVNSQEYDDHVSIGKIGLIKAAISFDESKNITFATYASRCIENEILMHYRKVRKYANDISINEPIANDGEGNELTIGDTIADSKSNFVMEIINKDEYVNMINIILNCLKEKYRLALLYSIGNMQQKEISDKLNVSQSYVSRLENKAAKKVREKIVSQQVYYKEVFSMKIVENEYIISFSSKDISKFNEIFAALLLNLTSVENLPDFRVDCNKERIIIKLPAHPESFCFIAQIIQEIDDFSISFGSNKITVPQKAINTETVVKPKKTVEVQDDEQVKAQNSKKVEVRNSEQIVPTLAGVDEVDKTNSDSTVKSESQVKQVREYMLSRDSFTTKDLRAHFPNFTSSTINNALQLAKKKKFITSIGTGKYLVNNKRTTDTEKK